MKVFLVGGAVRDQLLGLPVKERDYVVVGATPEEMQAQGYVPVGKDFPVFLHPESHAEYALARTERKSGHGYKGFKFYTAPDVSLEEDLRRRDLTVNAIAMDESTGEITDPYGGQEDLKARRLRHVSPAFVEDPVRVLRVARFAARFKQYNFYVVDETLALMRSIVRSGEMNALVSERVWKEFHSALGEKNPEEFLRVLRACSALVSVFPELDALYGVPNPPKYHPEIDSGVHTEMVLMQAARLSPDRSVRFAALVHDLGKGVTDPAEWPSHHGHEERGVALVKSFCEQLRVPKEFLDLGVLIAKYHGKCHRAEEMTPAALLRLLEEVDAFRRPDRFQQFLLACWADSRGRTGYEKSEYPQKERLECAFQAAASVEIKPIIDRGLIGEAIRDELHRQRVTAVKQALTQLKS